MRTPQKGDTVFFYWQGKSWVAIITYTDPGYGEDLYVLPDAAVSDFPAVRSQVCHWKMGVGEEGTWHWREEER